MKNNIFIIIFCLLIHFDSIGQKQLTLSDCHKMAIDNFPITQQKQWLQQASDLKLKSIATHRLPNVSLNGQVTHQSEVTSLPFDIPGKQAPQIPKTQYRTTLNIEQILYDGGLTKNQKNIEQSSLLINQQKIEISKYELKKRINQLYFSILLLDENIKLIDLLNNELQDKVTTLKSQVTNGIVAESQLLELKAEIIKVEQNHIEIINNRTAFIQMLGLLINYPIDENTTLKIPNVQLPTEDKFDSRPERQLFAYQNDLLSSKGNSLGNALTPKASAFLQTGVGQPALNFLDDQAKGFYVVGLRIKWNLWDWKKTSYARQQIAIQKNIISSEQKNFVTNTQVALTKLKKEINKLEKMIKKDHELIDLRTSIKSTASYQLNGGIITTTDYITKLNAELTAKQNNKIREMKRQLAKVEYLMLLGLELRIKN